MPPPFRNAPFAITDRSFAIASQSPGFSIFSRNGDRLGTFTQVDGAPSDEVWQLAWFREKLYVSFRDAFACFDPVSRTFRLLASSVSVEPKNPLDSRGSFFIRSLLADEEHNCLWLCIQDNALPRDRNGMWRFEPDSDTYTKVSGNHVSVAATKNGMILHLSARVPWAFLDTSSSEVRPLSNYCELPGAGTLYHHHFVAVGDHIITGAGYLLTPDGQSYVSGTEGKWNFLQRFNTGFITHYDKDQQTIWYVGPQ